MNTKDEIFMLGEAVISCDEDEMIRTVQLALERNIDPEEVSKVIAQGIMVVGEKYEKGEMFLPDLILAGNGAMKAMALINEAVLKRGLKKIKSPAKVVIGTVAGDVHNIGKDTVGAMLMAVGFEVHDLGINVPATQFLTMAETFQVDIVAISALMTTTMSEQEKIINLFKEKGKRDRFKILVGGAPTTPAWAEKIGADGHGANAGEAVKAAKQVLNT